MASASGSGRAPESAWARPRSNPWKNERQAGSTESGSVRHCSCIASRYAAFQPFKLGRAGSLGDIAAVVSSRRGNDGRSRSVLIRLLNSTRTAQESGASNRDDHADSSVVSRSTSTQRVGFPASAFGASDGGVSNCWATTAWTRGRGSSSRNSSTTRVGLVASRCLGKFRGSVWMRPENGSTKAMFHPSDSKAANTAGTVGSNAGGVGAHNRSQ